MEKDLFPSAPADAFFRHVPQPICWLDATFRLVATTHAFHALFPAAASPGAAFAAVERELPPRAGGTTWDAFWRSVQQGSEATIDVERRRTGEPTAELHVRGRRTPGMGRPIRACFSPTLPNRCRRGRKRRGSPNASGRSPRSSR